MSSYGKEAKDIRFSKSLDYSINVNGIVKEFMPDNSLVPIKSYEGKDRITGKKTMLVELEYEGECEEISLPRLVLGVFCGLVTSTAKIIYKDGDFRNCKNKNLKYSIDDITYNESMNEYYIYGEIYKHIPGFENYYISKEGIIYSKYFGEFVKRTISENGYYVATLSDKDGVRKPYKVHRLNWLTWRVPIPKDKIVDHRDTNRLNPSLENLQLLTQHENVQKDSDKIISYKLTENDVYQIRMMYSRGVSCSALADMFKVNLKNIYQTVQFINYKYYDKKPKEYEFTVSDIKDINYQIYILNKPMQVVANRYMTSIEDIESVLDDKFKEKYQPEVKETVTMTEETAREIYNSLKSGESNISLAKEYNVTNANISRIKKQFEKLENK